MRDPKVTVKIPRQLFLKIQHVVDGSGFNSPTDFIVFVLRDLMNEAEKHRASQTAGPEYSAEELEEVKRKLKNLGYL
ncbi:MAG: CopG family transcriptional regulator [Planctomycetota bacterium]